MVAVLYGRLLCFSLEAKTTLYKPTFMLPSTSMGDGQGVIDASVENTFSAEIKGHSPVVAYRVVIYKNNATSDIVYDSDIIAFATPFYGADSQGTPIRFEYIIPSNDDTELAYTTMENGYVYGYKYILTLCWNIDPAEYLNSIVSSYETVFFAKETPTISIEAFAESTIGTTDYVLSRSCIWNGSYSHASTIPSQWFQWTLALASDHTNIVDQTERIYANTPIQYENDGLLSDTSYAIKVDVQTPDGLIITSDWTAFTVSYASGTLSSVVVISQTSDNGVKLDWGGLQYIEGDPNNGDYQYLKPVPFDGHTAVELLAGNTITFASSTHFAVDIPLNADHVWSGYIDADSDEIYYAEGTDDDDQYYYINLSHAGSSVGLRPSDTLYPSDAVYPQADNGGYFLLDVNGDDAYTTLTTDYYPTHHWFVVKMSTTGMTVYASPIDPSIISTATIVSPT